MNYRFNLLNYLLFLYIYYIKSNNILLAKRLFQSNKCILCNPYLSFKPLNFNKFSKRNPVRKTQEKITSMENNYKENVMDNTVANQVNILPNNTLVSINITNNNSTLTDNLKKISAELYYYSIFLRKY